MDEVDSTGDEISTCSLDSVFGAHLNPVGKEAPCALLAWSQSLTFSCDEAASGLRSVCSSLTLLDLILVMTCALVCLNMGIGSVFGAVGDSALRKETGSWPARLYLRSGMRECGF